MPNGNVGTFYRARIKPNELNTKEVLDSVEVWSSELYEVHIRKNTKHGFGDHCNLWQLSINSKEQEPVRDWRDLQEIKNILCGPEAEGFELFPSESRKVDTRNQYHIWVLIDKNMAKHIRLPCGIQERNVVDINKHGLKQRAG